MSAAHPLGTASGSAAGLRHAMSDGLMPTANEMFGQRLAPAPWLSSRPVLALVLEVLPLIEDELTADLLEQVVSALADRDDELRVVRAVLSAALGLSHTQHVEILRLKKRLGDLLEAGRRECVAV